MPDEDAIARPLAPEVLNVPAKFNVLSADKSPPPVMAKPALIALDDETAEMERPRAFPVRTIGAVADNDVVVILALKATQSEAER